MTHWVWEEVFLAIREMDFAGGTVIHINAGIAGLVLSYLVGKRKAHSLEEVRKPSSIKFMVLGSALLWFGWFGFNSGSQLAADGIAANALLVTNRTATAGALIWLTIEWFIVSDLSGDGIWSYFWFGWNNTGFRVCRCFRSTCYWYYIRLSRLLGKWYLKSMMNHDDTLDAFGIHGLVGIAGALLTGIFANPDVNGGAGLLYGNPNQLWVQGKAVIITILYSGIATVMSGKFLN